MNTKEAELYQKLTEKMPKDTVIASSEPFEINRVLILSGWCYRVTKELTHEEFYKIHKENLQHANHAVGQMELSGSEYKGTEENALLPDSDQRYFYSLELLISEKEIRK